VVKVARVENGTVRRDINLVGDVEAMTSVQVFPKCQGRLMELTEKELEKVRSLFREGAVSKEPPDKIQDVEEGDFVLKNQIIAVIDHDNVEAQVNQARAAVATADARLKQAEVTLAQTETDLERIRNLYNEGATSKQTLDKIEAEYKSLLAQRDVAKATVEQSQAALNQAQIMLAECFIGAPISGIVSQEYLERGDMAMVTRPIMDIIDVDKVKVTTDLPERYIGQVSTGAEVCIRVDTFPNSDFQGTVTRVSPTVNIINRTAKLEITVDNADHALKPGMFARVTLNIIRREGVPVIEEAAVLRDESGKYVFVVEEGVARRRQIRLGVEEGPRAEVAEGLRPGDVLVVAGQQKLSEGKALEIQN